MTPDEYDSMIADPYASERFAGADAVRLLLVAGDAERIRAPGSVPVVVCWIGDRLGGEGPDGADLIIPSDRVDETVDTVERNPLAAVTLVTLLRAGNGVEVDPALALESAAYSMLQGGREFAAWRSGADPVTCVDDTPVLTDRQGSELHITLNRPHRHNAITTQLRDELYEALALAHLDESIERVVLSGTGPSFCSGGDLAEFGSRPDPVSAHATRLARSPARLAHHIGDRTVAHVHGSVLGGGIEIAAFAGRVVADPGSRFGLPEVTIGLIPGAGGTVSLPRRIGRQRTAALGVTGRPIDAVTALEWGLIDEINPASEAADAN